MCSVAFGLARAVASGVGGPPVPNVTVQSPKCDCPKSRKATRRPRAIPALFHNVTVQIRRGHESVVTVIGPSWGMRAKSVARRAPAGSIGLHRTTAGERSANPPTRARSGPRSGPRCRPYSRRRCRPRSSRVLRSMVSRSGGRSPQHSVSLGTDAGEGVTDRVLWATTLDAQSKCPFKKLKVR